MLWTAVYKFYKPLSWVWHCGNEAGMINNCECNHLMATRQHGEPLSLSSMLKSSVLVSWMIRWSELLSPLYVYLSKIKYCFHKYGLIFDYCRTLVCIFKNECFVEILRWTLQNFIPTNLISICHMCQNPSQHMSWWVPNGQFEDCGHVTPGPMPIPILYFLFPFLKIALLVCSCLWY